MKACELCKSKANIYCESDGASLCWNCDFKVHSANFLVARHLRSVLCHVCQCPTPWNASGEKLGRTISVCVRCVDGEVSREESEGGNDDEFESDEEEDGDSDSDDLEEEGDNQVVPWSDTMAPPAVSSSSSEESSSRLRNSGRDSKCLKRLRENPLDLCSEDDLDCISSYKKISTKSEGAAAERSGETSFVDSLPLKSQRIKSNQPSGVCQTPASLRSVALEQTTKRFHRKSGKGIGNDGRAVDCHSPASF